MRQRILAALMALSCLFLLMAPAARAEEEESEGRTIHITSVADLKQLATDCALDSYSNDLTVILDRDLDLSGETFYPIPTFNGVFEGGGHRISGMVPASDGSNQGLFRYLQADAVVRSLRVSGSVEPTIGQEHVGGIAGTSYGELRDCSFDGTVSGLNYVGGLVGENFGSIVGGSASGEVSGKRFTGGIAGYSSGLVSGCTNSARVNTEVSEATLSLEGLSVAATAPLALLNAEDENVVSDSGGIVGYSKGVVLGCVNHGAVGYQHFGYNVGGIAGRQSGYLSNCENYGDVLGRKDVAGIVGQMEPYLELVESMNLADELILLNAYMNAASGDLAAMSAEMQYAIDGMGSYSPELSMDLGGTIAPADAAFDDGADNTGTIGGGTIGGGSISGYAAGDIASDYGGTISENTGISEEDLQDYAGQIEGMDITLPENINTDDVNSISDAFAGLADNLSEMYGVVSESAGYLAEDLHLANNQFSRVLLLMSNALAGVSNNEVFADVSDELGETEIEGRVSNNLNLGTVDADSNVGGIVGAMGIEYEFDLEDTLVETVGANGIVNNSYDAKCVSSDNINRGAVTARKDRVGGVVGSSEMGAVLHCQDYGSVESAEGGYVGGVVGYSSTIIRNSYAMCDVKGSQYVGGIVGYGAEITDCVSLIEAGAANACLGAIAGFADMSDEERVTGNLYVHESLGAVDGISYTDRAMPVSYETLVALEGLPDNFKALRLTFLADGRVVKELLVDYGGSVPASDIPAVPEKAGYSGVWEEFETENLRFSATVNAVYTLYQSALATTETREDSPMSIVLVEGEFDDSVAIQIQPYDDPGVLAADHVLESWQLHLDNMTDPDTGYNVRYLLPKLEKERAHTVEIQRLVNGRWVKVDATANGSYVSFPVQGDTVTFRAVEVNRFEPKTVVIAVAGAVALLAVLIILSAHRRQKRRAKEAQD